MATTPNLDYGYTSVLCHLCGPNGDSSRDQEVAQHLTDAHVSYPCRVYSSSEKLKFDFVTSTMHIMYTIRDLKFLE